MFDDPALIFRCDVPIDWCLDRESSLFRVVFHPWDRLDERVVMTSIPTAAPPIALPEEWGELARRSLGCQDAELSDEVAPTLALVGFAAESEAGRFRRVVVRGEPFDVVADHVTPTPPGEPMSDVLRRFLRQTRSPAMPPPDAPSIQEAADAVASLPDDMHPFLASFAYNDLRRAAQRSWLLNLPARSPEAFRQMLDALQMMVEVGLNSPPVPSMLRQSHSLLFRCVPEASPSQPAIPLDPTLWSVLRFSFVPAHSRATQALRQLVTEERFAEVPDNVFASYGFSEWMYARLLLGEAIRSRQSVERARMPVAISPTLGREAVFASMNALGVAALRLLAEGRRGELFEHAYDAGHTLLEYLDLLQAFERRDEHLEAARALAAFGERLVRYGGGDAQMITEGRRLQAAGLGHAANVLTRVGDRASLTESLGLLSRAGELDAAGGESIYRLNLLREQALAAVQLGDGQLALRTIDLGRTLAARLGDPRAAPHLASNAAVFDHLERIARTVVMEAPRTVRSLPELEVAESLARRGRDGAIEDLSHQILAPKEDPFDIRTTELLTEAAMLLGDTEEGRSARAAAEALLDLTRIRSGDDVTLAVGGDEWTAARSLSGQSVDAALDAGDVLGAVEVAERARARVLLLDLTARPAHLDGIEDAVRTVPAEFFQTFQPIHAPEPGDTAGAAAAIDRVAKGVKWMVERILPPSVSPLTREEVLSAVASHGQPILMIHPVENRLVLLLLTPEGAVVPAVSPHSTEEILGDITEMQRALGMPVSSGRTATAGTGVGRPSMRKRARDGFEAAASRLYEELISPVEQAVGTYDQMTIAPYREFNAVPFALLPDKEGRLLVDKMAVSVIPSISTLAALQRPRREPALEARAFVVGDPAISPDIGLEQLPSALREAREVVRQIAKRHPSTVVVHVEGADATPDSYRVGAVGARLVHLSCHAGLGASLGDSTLYLAPDPGGGSTLTVEDVARVPLDRSLVFLAACRTGAGRPTAEGTLGLAREFLRAGAAAVVASYWPVDDKATAALVKEFYRSYLGTGASVAEALREAMLLVRGDVATDSLASRARAEHSIGLWGGFFMLGDGAVVDEL